MAENSLEKKPKNGGWRSAIFIIFVEMAERFAYYGVAGNLFMYLTKVLGQSTAAAAKNVNTWGGVSAIFPVVGGFLADSYVGRYKMVVISTTIYLSGLVLLTLAASAVPPGLRHIVFFTALYVIAIGEGGHKPCVQTFAADQFDEALPGEKAAKSSFFNWWYVGIVIGAVSAVLAVIYVEDYVGWSVGYGMLAAAVVAALMVFLIGSRTYRRQDPVGSPLTRVAQVMVAAVRKQRLAEREVRGTCNECEGVNMEEGGGGLIQALGPTSRFRFLNKAMLMDETDASSDEKRNPWRLCSVNQVEEVKLVLQLIPVWVSCLMFAVVIAQLNTYFTKQSSTMNRFITKTYQIPPASFQVFTGITILTSVLLYERAFVPIARRFTNHPSGITMLQRIGIGLIFSILTMVVAACVESKRVRVARQNGLLDTPKVVVPMAVWWLIPQYMLCGVSDVFAIVGLQELFYDQMPAEMRSIGAAGYLSVTGVGSFLSSGLISIMQGMGTTGNKWLGDNINRANLDYFYWVLAALSAVNFCGYVYVAKRVVYKKIRGEPEAHSSSSE